MVGKPEQDRRRQRLRLGQLLLCGWPGLAHLWLRGGWFSLVWAVGFSILLNLALIATFVWPNLLGETFPLASWPVVTTVWLGSALFSLRRVAAWSSAPPMAAVRPAGHDSEPESPSPDTLFIQAQREYLKGHWTEASTQLERILQREPRDIEARLLRATLLRHREQWSAALDELETLERFDESVHWHFEIQRERQRIERDRQDELSCNPAA